MRKICASLLGLILAFYCTAYASNINNISSDKWLDHLSQMQMIRKQILDLLISQNPTSEDKEMLKALEKSFEEKKIAWDQYLVDVAEGNIKDSNFKGTFCNNTGKRLCNCSKDHDCNTKGKCKCDCHSCCSDNGKCHHEHNKCKCACNEKKVKCHEGSDCQSCPNYKTIKCKCCKVSGKCTSECKHDNHH